MQLLVFSAAAAVVFVIAYAIDLGGTLSAMLALLVLVAAGGVRAFDPLIRWIRGSRSA